MWEQKQPFKEVPIKMFGKISENSKRNKNYFYSKGRLTRKGKLSPKMLYCKYFEDLHENSLTEQLRTAALRNRDREFDRELPANIKQNKAVVQCCFKLSFYWSVCSLKQVKGSFHCLKNRNKYQNFQQIHYETNSLIHYDTLLHG